MAFSRKLKRELTAALCSKAMATELEVAATVGPAAQATVVAALGTTTNLSAIAASYADEAAARTSVNTLKGEVEARLDAIEAKVDETLAALKVALLMASS